MGVWLNYKLNESSAAVNEWTTVGQHSPDVSDISLLLLSLNTSSEDQLDLE